MKENPSLVHGQYEDTVDTSAVDAMRERLREYRSLNKEIDNEIERLERMELKITSVGSPVLSDMPKTPSTLYDRLADSVAQKVDLEEEIRELIAQRGSERKAIDALVRKLKKANERAVIRMRYLDNEDWGEIQMMIFGGEEDFNEKYDNYKQRMFRLHSAAISNMALLVE